MCVCVRDGACCVRVFVLKRLGRWERFGNKSKEKIKSRLLGIGGGSGGACEMRRGHASLDSRQHECPVFFLDRLKHKRSVRWQAPRAKGTTQYAMDCLNGGAIQRTALSSHVGCRCNPQNRLARKTGGARVLCFFWLCRPSNPSIGWDGCNNFFLGTPLVVLFVQFIQLLVCTHTLYLCGVRGSSESSVQRISAGYASQPNNHG